MDVIERIEMTTAEIQTALENRIAINPDDLKAIDELWSVQKLRFENACSMTREGETWKPKS